MERKGRVMKLRRVIAFVLVMTGVAAAWGAGQTAAPKDPELIDLQGYQRILQQYKGKPLLVNFWATYCEPCRDEYPMLNGLAKQYAPEGLKVVGISMDQDGDLILMRRFLARYKPVFPNYRKKKGDEEAFSQGVMSGWNGSLPMSVFYGKDGTIVGRQIGAADHNTYDAAIRALLSK